jgi:hypothetical protein
MHSHGAGLTIPSTAELTGELLHSMSGKFYELPSSTLDGPFQSLNAAYPVVV